MSDGSFAGIPASAVYGLTACGHPCSASGRLEPSGFSVPQTFHMGILGRLGATIPEDLDFGNSPEGPPGGKSGRQNNNTRTYTHRTQTEKSQRHRLQRRKSGRISISFTHSYIGVFPVFLTTAGSAI